MGAGSWLGIIPPPLTPRGIIQIPHFPPPPHGRLNKAAGHTEGVGLPTEKKTFIQNPPPFPPSPVPGAISLTRVNSAQVDEM
jgi:hypothetical protein